MRKLTTLDNGLRIVSHQMQSVKSVAFGVFNNVGSRDEIAEINGSAHFLEHMAFKGTKKRNALEIAKTIDDVGGAINAYTSEEVTAYYSILMSEHLHVGVDIITDILQNSIFESKEFETERGVILQEIGMYLDTPLRMVHDYWQKTAFPDQPIGRLILGKKEIIKSIEREKIIEFMQNNYNSKKMIFSAAGKVNHEEFVEMVKNSISNLPNGKLNKRSKALYHGGEYREQKDLEQIHMVLGFMGTDYYDEDFEALQVYSTLMGTGMSSRLFQEIREKRGLVYSIHSDADSYSDTGTFQVIAGTGKNEIKELLPVLCDELSNSITNLTEDEIKRAKAQIKSGIVMSMESSSSNAGSSAYQLIKYNKLIDIDQRIKKINDVTKDSIEKIVSKVFKSQPTIASIGPIQNLEELDKIKKRFN
tara:strand:+ start:1632 stop:2885 length:1254 start_codon:yes stop_codon:yes gene_type:complete